MSDELTTLTPEQDAIRLTGVGSSVAPIILGLHPHRTPFEIWLSYKKRDLRPIRQHEENDAAEFGVLAEPLIANLYQRRHPEVHLQHSGKVTLQLKDTIALATLDYQALPADYRSIDLGPTIAATYIVECKSKDYRTFRAFGEAGTDQVPQEIGAQVQWQMLVSGFERADVAALVDRRLYEFTVRFDRELAEQMYAMVLDWWNRYVVGNEEPPMTGKAVEGYLRKKFALVLDDVRRADDLEAELLHVYAEARAQTKRSEALEEETKGTLLAQIGHSKGIESDNYRALWSPVKGRTTVDWESVAMEYRASLELDASIAVEPYRSDVKKELDETIAKYTKVGEPSRRLTLRDLTGGAHE